MQANLRARPRAPNNSFSSRLLRGAACPRENAGGTTDGNIYFINWLSGGGRAGWSITITHKIIVVTSLAAVLRAGDTAAGRRVSSGPRLRFFHFVKLASY